MFWIIEHLLSLVFIGVGAWALLYGAGVLPLSETRRQTEDWRNRYGTLTISCGITLAICGLLVMLFFRL